VRHCRIRGAALKVVLISAVVAGVTAIGEAMAVADALGLPEDLVKAAMPQSPVAGIAGRAFAQGSHFAIRLAAKDVALAAASADLPVSCAVHTRLLEFPAEREEDVAIAAVVRTAQLLINPFGYWSRYLSGMPTLSGHPADRYNPVALQNWPRV
jgi:3-hydroxyisobutyrate dehydrogenase-like beta-hydroxyacid dehydrogenase